MIKIKPARLVIPVVVEGVADVPNRPVPDGAVVDPVPNGCVAETGG